MLKSAGPTTTNIPNILVPTITSVSDTYDADAAADLLEWLGLVSLDSPRIRADDSIDPYLSRYQVPELGEGSPITRNLVRMRWYGFIPPTFIRDVYIRARKVVGEEWFAMNASCFHGQAYSVLNYGPNDTLSWEYS
jgi:ribonuclease P/MRP protein subunit RPP40